MNHWLIVIQILLECIYVCLDLISLYLNRLVLKVHCLIIFECQNIKGLMIISTSYKKQLYPDTNFIFVAKASKDILIVFFVFIINIFDSLLSKANLASLTMFRVYILNVYGKVLTFGGGYVLNLMVCKNFSYTL